MTINANCGTHGHNDNQDHSDNQELTVGYHGTILRGNLVPRRRRQVKGQKSVKGSFQGSVRASIGIFRGLGCWVYP